MKIKCRPEDFRVEELIGVQPSATGAHVLYRLTKRGLGTIEAIEAIRRRWQIPAFRLRHGGLKDRHAETVQYLTIQQGPDRALHQESFDLEPVGRLERPYGPDCFRGNRFELAVRDLTDAQAGHALQIANAVPREGLPNYFDDQRFGSVGFDGRFIAEEYLKGEPEQALWLALAAASPYDRSRTKAEKAALRATWGRWPEAKAALPRSHARSLVTYLADHPTDFRGAFARVKRELRSLYFSAHQSYLWNRILAGVIERRTRPEQRLMLAFRLDQRPLYQDLEPGQAEWFQELSIALPSARNTAPDGVVGEVAREVLAQRSLQWNDLRIRGLKDLFLSKGSRRAVFAPEAMEARAGDDELHPGRRQVRLVFELPRGAYATLVIKRLTAFEGSTGA